MIIEVDTVKGFRDMMPPASLKRRAVREIIERIFSVYGFLPLETPVIELDELMRPDNLQEEDEAVSDRFRLKDRGGRNLGMRYEFTFQLARIFKQHPTIKLPFRRYQIGENFRDEPIGPDRYRQFTQCDVDIIGEGSIDAEVELLALTRDLLAALNIDAEIHVNHRKLIASLIESVQIRETAAVMRELDKIGKLGEDMVKSNLRKYADANQILTLFKLLEKNLAFYKVNAFEGAKELDELEKKCRRLGIALKIKPMMIRGLSYYTGTIFEVQAKEGGNSIGGGGRYDNLVGKHLQKQIPAAGISFGLDRVVEAANIAVPAPVRAIVVSISKDAQAAALTHILRSAGIPTLVALGKSPGKALEYANALHIPYAIFVGEEELAKKKFKLRDMEHGEERYLMEKSLVSILKKAEKMLPEESFLSEEKKKEDAQSIVNAA